MSEPFLVLVDQSFKIVFLGDPGVGKTSIVKRYTKDTFNNSYFATLGVDYSKKSVRVNNGEVNGLSECILHIFDLAGHEGFEIIRNPFLMRSDALILVYDLVNKDCLTNIEKWIKHILYICSCKLLHLFIVGNKLDVSQKNSKEMHDIHQSLNSIKNRYRRILSLEYLETSAMTGKNITELFEKVVDLLNGIAD